MIRYIWRWILLISGLWLLLLLMIRAQPTNISDMRELLMTSEDCPMPCFMGIRPGVTSLQEMTAILDQHPWIVPNSHYNPEYLQGSLHTWRWSEAAPAWIAHKAESALYVSGFRVTAIIIETTIPWSEVLLSIGKPDRSRLRLDESSRPGLQDALVQHIAWYAQWHMEVMVTGFCRDVGFNTYDWPVRLRFQMHPTESQLATVDHGVTMAYCR